MALNGVHSASGGFVTSHSGVADDMGDVRNRTRRGRDRRYKQTVEVIGAGAD